MMGEWGRLSEKTSLIKLTDGSHRHYSLDVDGQNDKYNGLAITGIENQTVKRDEEAWSVSIERDTLILDNNDRLDTPIVSDVGGHEETPGEHSGGEDQQIQCERDVGHSGRFSLKKTPIKKQVMLLLCVFAVFVSGCSCSLIAIFFPPEAQSKGMSLTLIGFVFGVYGLVMFLASPVIGKYMPRIGVKFVCLSGIFVNGTTVIIFGVLDKAPDGPWFSVMCMVCRAGEAVGFAALFIACMTIASTEFHKQIGIMSAIIESSSSIAFTVGPVFGGLLYQLGGYGLPFYFLGGLILVNGLVLYFVLPDIQTKRKDEQKRSFLCLLRSPMIVICLIGTCLGPTGLSMYESLFTPHMAPFKLSASSLGWVFTPGPLTYFIFAIFWGCVSNNERLHRPLLVLGQLFFGLVFFVNEPGVFLPFIPFKIWTVTLSYVLMNVCVALLQIFGMRCMFNGAYEMNFEKNVETNAMVSGLYKTAYSCGVFCGPIGGGAAVDTFGFPTTYAAFGLVNICFVLVIFAYFSLLYIQRKTEIK